MTDQKNSLENLVLRIGVAFAFLYPAIDAFFDPYTWIGYFPKFLHGLLPNLVLLHSFGAIEMVIAVWILSGKRILWPSIAATALLTAIILFNLGDFQIIFRDVSIAAISLALAIRASREEHGTVVI